MLDENTKNLPSGTPVDEDKNESKNVEKESEKANIPEEVVSEEKTKAEKESAEPSEGKQKLTSDAPTDSDDKPEAEETDKGVDKPENDGKPKEVAKQETEIPFKAELKSEDKSKPENESKTGAELKSEDESKPENESKTGAESKPENESKPEAGSKPEKDEKTGNEDKKTTETTVDKESKESVKIQIPSIQFSKLSLDDLVKMFEEFLMEYDIKDIKNQIEELKSNFTKKFNALLREKREEHESQGGDKSDFYYESPVKQKFDALIREYKKKRQQYYRDIEREQKQNLEIKLALIEELKDLIDSAEPATMYKSFKDLQEKWRSVGQIPRANYNDVWRTYHHHVERFYDLLHLNNDFRDLDFKHNLEEKTKLVETAEKLAQQEDVNNAFKELQILHRMWKEDIGPVAREHREEIWNRFSEATKKIHKKRHELQDRLQEKYKENVGLKLEVIERIKAMDLSEVNSHKLWQEQIKKLEKMRDEFFAIGKVPRSKSEEVWQQFRQATREFNKAKNNFYKSLKKGQAENLKRKMELVEKAESMKDSEVWEEATEMFKKIQAEWKTIGHVPRKDSDAIWKRFKAACNHYFDRLHEKKSDVTKDQSKAIDSKKSLLNEIKGLLDSKDLSIDLLEEQIKKWRDLGSVPAKMRHLESKFGKVLDTAYKKLGLEKEEAEFLKFKNLVDSYVDSNNHRRLDSEQMFVRKKVDEVTREIKQLENNISFISNASEDNPLVKNVYKNIEEQKKELEGWKKKLDYISRLEY
jgi:hypothetical protein